MLVHTLQHPVINRHNPRPLSPAPLRDRTMKKTKPPPRSSLADNAAQLFVYDALGVLGVKVREEDEALAHSLVEDDRIRVFAPFTPHLAVLVLDDQHLYAQRARVQARESKNEGTEWTSE